MSHQKACPNCGHCPACGRSNFRPWYPTYPYRVGDFFYQPNTQWSPGPTYTYNTSSGTAQ